MMQIEGFLILKTSFSLVLCQALSGSLLFLSLDVLFVVTRLLTQKKGFLILKSIFSLSFCQMLQRCLLFLGLDMYLMLTCH